MACTGPDQTKWDGETCVGTSHQTSCDSLNQATCFYADLQFEEGGQGVISPERQYCGGQFVDKSDCGDFRIDTPGPLAKLSVKAGDVVVKLNGKKPTAKVILSYTATKPATAGLCTRTTDDSRIEVCLFR
jgi:hypothetical protein